MPLNATPRAHSCGGVIYRRIAVQVKTDTYHGLRAFPAVQPAKPGGHVLLNQAGSTACRIVHNPHFDCDDHLPPFGESYWLSLVGRALPLE
jgi:hypothetical protein